MKTIIITLVTVISISVLNAQELKEANPDFRHWQIGIGFGEIPMAGSFKPSLTFGYHFNEKIYVGAIYQFKDDINRNGSSFNADGTGLSGLTKSHERVGQRFMLQGRYTPVRFAPYISFGVVFNDQDREVMEFAEQDQQIGNNTYHTGLTVTQTRKAGWSPAIGLGYQYDFKFGLSINAEWTPGWFVWVPTPDIQVEAGETIAQEDLDLFKEQTTDEFKSHVTNLYKVFHIGLAYRF